jgi:HD-GYP domain-containing protein (c-di-GMP phosphodiesterase class II)
MGGPRQLLEQAAGALSARGAAVLTVNSAGRFAAVFSYSAKGDWDVDALPEDVAEQALKADDLTQGTVVTHGPGPEERHFAMPLEVGPDLLGVLVVAGLEGPAPSAAHCRQRLGPLVEAVALAAERACLLDELDKREEEVAALTGQLQIYAADFRTTYARERARSSQAAKALTEAQQTSLAAFEALAGAVESRDRCSTGHVRRVVRYATMLTELVAPQHAMDPQFKYGFLLHDIGKLNLPEELLAKSAPLDTAERALVQRHPVMGSTILEKVKFLGGAKEIVHSHHERWDGNGYPEGLRGSQIPCGARIFALCDAFDAMTNDRPYRAAVPTAEALGRLRSGAGAQFWPEAAEAFLSIPQDELEMVRGEGKDG